MMNMVQRSDRRYKKGLEWKGPAEWIPSLWDYKEGCYHEQKQRDYEG